MFADSQKLVGYISNSLKLCCNFLVLFPQQKAECQKSDFDEILLTGALWWECVKLLQRNYSQYNSGSPSGFGVKVWTGND